MYPIKHYFDFLIRQRELNFQLNGYSAVRMNEIINARYRERKYKIYWLLFSTEKENEADISMVERGIISIHPNDDIVVADISFKTHISHKTYPNAEYILSQLPENIETLVIGGFHRDDCVDRLAIAAYKKGLNTRVDEDVTDCFFILTTLNGTIPLIREKNLLDMSGTIFDNWKKSVIESYKEDSSFFQSIGQT
jgi:hypothetical protein